jgi:FtsH-binding integral membrane protein
MPEVQTFGMQARVSGLSLDPRHLGTLIPAEPHGPVITLPTIPIPQLDVLSWMTATLLTLAIIGGLYAGVLAVYTYSTPSAEWPAVIVTLVLFGSALLLQIGAAAMRHFFPMPPLQPGPAERYGAKAQLDAATRTAVFFLVLAVIGLGLGAVLAVYDWRTPDAEFPLFLGVLICLGLALVVKVGDAAARHLGGRR